MNNSGKRYKVQIAPVLRNKDVQTYSSLGLSFVAIIIFGIFAIKPTIENIVSLQNQIEVQSKTLKAIKDKSAKLAQAINNYNSIPEDTKIKLFTLLPNVPNPTCLIDTLISHAGGSKVLVAGLQIQPFDLKGQTKCAVTSADLPAIEKDNSTSSALKEIPFTVNTTNGYPALTSYINSFNSSIRLISVESAFFNKNDTNLVLSVSGKAYYYK